MTLNYLRKRFSSRIMCHLTKIHRISQHFIQPTRHSSHYEDSSWYDWKEENRINFDTVTNGKSDVKKKLRLVELEICDYRMSDANPPIPEKLRDVDYKILVDLPTYEIRKRFLFELSQYMKRNKHWSSVHENREKENFNIPNHIWYGPGHCCFSEKSFEDMLDVLNTASCASMCYSNDIVIDLSFEDEMEIEEISKCVKELKYLLMHNQLADSPFNIHFCNFKKKGKISRLFKSKFHTDIQKFPVNVHEESYLDIFNREQLIYLSPHAKDELVHYNTDHIYILGGVVDKFPFDSAYSYKKAKSENLDVRKFPVDEFLNWKRGSKTFSLVTSYKILTDLNYYRKWEKGFENLDLSYVENYERQRKVYQFRNIITALDKKIL